MTVDINSFPKEILPTVLLFYQFLIHNNLLESYYLNYQLIVHFKELFALDGKPSNFSEGDIARRNTIANLLKEWGLVEIVNPSVTENPVSPISQIKVLPHKEKSEWDLVAKYNIGKKKAVA